ncbi:MAG: phosphomannose isomerase type II C-terminal cupin domain [Candidatus Pacebacteria bacterium]|nr:phosphomannose isomerase type II C-terminal cupin domain [Candidatus Paceibacterota bacterium]
MNNNLKIYQEDRPWGYFRRFTHNISSTVKIISVKPNEELSLQSHKKREEFWRVIKGSGTFQLGENRHNVVVGDEQFVPLGSKHTIKSGSEGMEVLEIALGEFDEDDITRYEDKYGRV